MIRHDMTTTILSRQAWALALAIAGCVQAPADLASRDDFSSDLVRSTQDIPPDTPADACWARDDTPAVIETVTEQVLLTPEILDEAGNLVQPPVYSNKVDQRIVKDRQTVWFQTPCPDQVDAAFVATLQRALKARGFYLLPLSGEMDAATLDAVRRFQATNGLDSAILSLSATRDLGLIEVPRADL
jgi:hypothetical protein